MIIIAVAVVIILFLKYHYKKKFSKKECEIRHEFYLREQKLKERIEYQKERSSKSHEDFYYKEKQYKKDIKDLSDKLKESENKLFRSECLLDIEKNKFIDIIKNDPPFFKIKSLVADAESLVYDEAAEYLDEYKRAWKSAEIVKDLKHKYRELLENYKELQYKYEYMLAQFPELTNYIEEHSYEIISGTDDDDYDHARNWLSQEEYESLSEDERNQRALDNWLSGHKRTNSEVGYDYEMYIGYRYRTSPIFKWKVEQYGISKGLNDLGRDIIATREDHETGNTIVEVVQCKYWSQEKQIHENVIAQLFGTAMMYKLEHMDEFIGKGKLIVIPSLMTSTEPSDTAIRFAKLLHVRIRVEPMNEYPRIKCNVNRTTGEKIYHLPFDQQYHNVKIENDNEFYAYTVAEAVSKGFRRAYRHLL